ncbi:putative sulfate exporter family transporter [Vagococcus sp. BWB3-3]|uniref:Sulfate exporter family transporter n=1 Tax=Vagococcus allomyrinae TaxID=2794353 RepID=A0A940P850_9ENTE|nr:putative sulfate exporter family transporter [Vagococcus allomyrinae]MBP1039835.1 putative sulfate exporter family transporter [Vagococcus allomyrinae]
MEKIVSWLKDRWQGFIVCLVIAIVAQVVGSFVPQIGAALFAILLGILCGNTFLNRESFAKGVRFSESKLLEYSIALTGLTLNITDVMGVGWRGISFIVLQMTLTIILAYKWGQWFGFGRKFSLLMCAGNAVCGSSAIGTISPIIEADEKDKGISITIVNLTGTILMVGLPVITSFLYQHQTMPTSAMIGGVLQSIGQVIASGKLVNEDVTQFATIFKILRIILLVVVALSFSRMNTSDQGGLFEKGEGKKRAKVGIPWFITVFFVFCLVISFGNIPDGVSLIAKKVSSQFEIIALAGIGMRVKFRDLVKEGPKAMALGGTIGLSQVAVAIILIFLLIK